MWILLLSVYCGQLLEHDICLVVLFMCHCYCLYYCIFERYKWRWRITLFYARVDITKCGMPHANKSKVKVEPEGQHIAALLFTPFGLIIQQAVGGRPPRYASAQACNGSAQRQPWARPVEPGPISQYAPSSRPAAHAGRRPDVRDRRQTDRHQTASSLNAPWARA